MPQTTNHKGGYTKRMRTYNNYKGDKFGIYVNESGLGGGWGDSCAKKRHVGSNGGEPARGQSGIEIAGKECDETHVWSPHIYVVKGRK